MRKTLFCGLLLSLFGVAVLSAAPVDVKRAEQMAQQQLQSVQPLRGGEYALSLAYTSSGIPVRGDQGIKDYYIFNLKKQDGFVIVAGDDRLPQPILGYSLESPFGVEGMPEHIKHWLEANAYQVQQLRTRAEGDESVEKDYFGAELRKIYAKYPNPISVLMPDIRWSQDDPYNMLTPQKSPSGCMATAMAQVMRYHCWPLASRGKTAYVDSRGNFRKYEFGHVLDWNNMTNIYNKRSTEEERAAVALLMLECGYAAKMRWTPNGSGAYSQNAFEGLRRYFNYSAKLQYVQQIYYNLEDWLDIIMKELQEKRPVLYAGSALGVGHAFVCDGYDGKGFFHFNWGWEGISNGYYSLSDMLPKVQSTGGGGEGGYNMLVDAIIGWEPNLENAQKKEIPNIKAYELETPKGRTISQNVKLEKKDWIRLFALSNNGFDSIEFRPILRIINANGEVKREIPAFEEDEIQHMDGGTMSNNPVPFKVTFEGLEDGIYELVPYFITVPDNTEYLLRCMPRFGKKMINISKGKVRFYNDNDKPKLKVNKKKISVTDGMYSYLDFEIKNEGNTAYTALFAAGWSSKPKENPENAGFYVLQQSLRLEPGESRAYHELVSYVPNDELKYLQFYWDPSNGVTRDSLLDIGYGYVPGRVFDYAELDFKSRYETTETNFTVTLQNVPEEVLQGDFLKFNLEVKARRNTHGVDAGLKVFFFNRRTIDTIWEYALGACYTRPDSTAIIPVKIPVNFSPNDDYYFRIAYQVERISEQLSPEGKERKIYRYVDLRPKVEASFKVKRPADSDGRMDIPDYGVPLPGGTPVEDPILQEVKVAPNPCKDVLWVRNTPTLMEYQLLSLEGLLLRKGVCEGEETKISIEDCAPGVYLLRMKATSGLSRTIKVVKL